MAGRPKDNLIEGMLDNSAPGKVTGWLKFLGMQDMVRLDLAGDFREDIRGRKLRLSNPRPSHRLGRPDYMDGFAAVQTGEVGRISLASYPYIEWHSRENGRVVLELTANQVEVVGGADTPGAPRPLGRHWCGGTLVKDGRKVRCAKCDYRKPLRPDGRPPRLPNGMPVHVRSDHFAEECDGVVARGEFDGGWLYRVKVTAGDAPAVARNQEGEYWFWDFEVTLPGCRKR